MAESQPTPESTGLRATLELPEVPEIPAGSTDGVDGLPSPLIDSSWGCAEQCRRLIAHKAYEGNGA